MTIYAIMLPNPQPNLAAAILATYPDDHYKINETQWLVSGTGTALEVVSKLGIYDPKDSGRHTGTAVVFATTSYHGRAPTAIWDWIKVKLEGGSNG